MEQSKRKEVLREGYRHENEKVVKKREREKRRDIQLACMNENGITSAQCELNECLKESNQMLLEKLK